MDHVFGMDQREWDDTVLNYLECNDYADMHNQWDEPIDPLRILTTAKQQGYGNEHVIPSIINGLHNMLEAYIAFEQNNYHRLNDALFDDYEPEEGL